MFVDAVKELLGVEPHIALMYFMCVLLGVAINWAKRSRELGLGLMEYWTSSPGRSQTAVIGTMSAFVFTMIADPESGKLAYIAIGFACDNLLNGAKASEPQELTQYKQLAEANAAKINMLEKARGEQ